jgi:hypothetical protein
MSWSMEVLAMKQWKWRPSRSEASKPRRDLSASESQFA